MKKLIFFLLLLPLLVSAKKYPSEYLVVKSGDSVSVFTISLHNSVQKISKEVLSLKNFQNHYLAEENPLLIIVQEDYTYDSRDRLVNDDLYQNFQKKVESEKEGVITFLALSRDSLRRKNSENKNLKKELVLERNKNLDLESKLISAEEKISQQEKDIKFYRLTIILLIIIFSFIPVAILTSRKAKDKLKILEALEKNKA